MNTQPRPCACGHHLDQHEAANLGRLACTACDCPDWTSAAFVVGQRYSCRALGDHTLVWRFTVTARTARTVTILEDLAATPQRRTVRVFNGIERVDPFGRYSLSPVLSADQLSDGAGS